MTLHCSSDLIREGWFLPPFFALVFRASLDTWGGSWCLEVPWALLAWESPGERVQAMLAAQNSGYSWGWNTAISSQPRMLLPEFLHLVNKTLQTSSLLAAWHHFPGKKLMIKPPAWQSYLFFPLFSSGGGECPESSVCHTVAMPAAFTLLCFHLQAVTLFPALL